MTLCQEFWTDFLGKSRLSFDSWVGLDFSYSEQRQKLMTAEQVTGMKADDLLLLVVNRNPLKAKQNLYFKSNTYRGRFDQNRLN